MIKRLLQTIYSLNSNPHFEVFSFQPILYILEVLLTIN